MFLTEAFSGVVIVILIFIKNEYLHSHICVLQEGLKLRGKELSPSQMEVVLNSEGTKNPLFLKIVLEVRSAIYIRISVI